MPKQFDGFGKEIGPGHPGNYPLDEIIAVVTKHAERGDLCFVKFTCANCGARQTFDEPNIIYTSGSCEECGHVTDLRVAGANFMVLLNLSPQATEHSEIK